MKLILPDRNLTICNLCSPLNKAINLHILQPNSEDWMIVGDFNSHCPSWGYPSLDAKEEEVEHWIVNNRLVLINTPTDPPTFFSRVWKTTSTPDIAITTDWNYKKADWKRFRELTDIYTKSITFSKHIVSKTASNFNSTVLKAAKESFQEADGMTTSRTGTIPWRRSTRN